jgi:hypothetical protein
VEIADPDFASAFVLVGQSVWFAQPRPADLPDAGAGDGLTILGRPAALRLAELIIEKLR